MPHTIPIACSLDQAELPSRAEAMAHLGEHMLGVASEGRTATLRFPSDQVAELERFVEAESACCPFFDFDLQLESGGPATLDVSGPEGGEWAVRGLVAGFAAGWGGLA